MSTNPTPTPPRPKSVPETEKVNRHSHLRWVPVNQTKVSSLAQREQRASFVDFLTANFDPDKFGIPVVSWRDGWFFIIDGQHRIAAVRQALGDDQQVQCECFEGMSEEEEAEMFLARQKRIGVRTFDEFRVAITAGREVETDIDRIVRAQGLKIAQSVGEGAISAVGALRKVYVRSSPATLTRTLRIVRDSYGTAGFKGPVIEGLGLVFHRYNGEIPDERAVQKLSTVHGGVNGLMAKARMNRQKMGRPMPDCVAAAAVEIINSGGAKDGAKGGKRLPSWWT